jgi:hypothetical protein
METTMTKVRLFCLFGIFLGARIAMAQLTPGQMMDDEIKRHNQLLLLQQQQQMNARRAELQEMQSRAAALQAAQQRDYWGAIAIDFVGKESSGGARNFPDPETAAQSAVKACGDPGCKAVITFKNGCAALAVSKEFSLGVGAGGSKVDAQKVALTDCRRNASTATCLPWVEKCSGYGFD